MPACGLRGTEEGSLTQVTVSGLDEGSLTAVTVSGLDEGFLVLSWQPLAGHSRN